jgi:hypothetical protein
VTLAAGRLGMRYHDITVEVSAALVERVERRRIIK